MGFSPGLAFAATGSFHLNETGLSGQGQQSKRANGRDARKIDFYMGINKKL